MNTIKISEFNEKALSLFSATRSSFENSSIDEIKSKVKEVPTKFIDDNKKIRIVFAGQYSAGKSSILSYITGKRLAVGQGITTDKCTYIDWNGIEVVDTPGIHTQKRPDHDKITYDAMSEADLIIFVCTVEGFSQGLGKHFRKLLIEKGKGNEMMLVFNKFESSLYGNTEQGHEEFFKKDVLPVISPEYTATDLFISYIDTYAYEDSLDSEGKEREELLQMSGYPLFYQQINSFIAKKNIVGKCTTSLYKLEQLLSEAMSKFKTGDVLKDGSLELLNQQRSMLLDSKEHIKSKAYSTVQESIQKIRTWGNDIANQLSSSDSEKRVNSMLQTKYAETDSVFSDLMKKLEEIIKLENGHLQKQIIDLEKSEFVISLENEIKRACGNLHISDKTQPKLNKAAQIASEAGQWLDKFAKGKNAKDGWQAIFKLGNYSGSKAHDAVLKVGHIVGHKFKPWEAVKIAGKVGKFGKILGVGGALLGVVIQIWDDQQQRNIETQLLEYRSGIRNSFNEAAKAIEMKFNEETQTWVEQNVDTHIKDIDNTIKSIEETSIITQKEYSSYHNLLEQTRKLISCIHMNLK